MQVFLDSPMAISATEIFERYSECLDPETVRMFRQGGNPFHVANLHFARETADSVAINRITGGAIIIAGSGMCTGGRICHHLRHNLWRRESAVVFVGFAASGTIARRIIDGASHVRLFGEDIRFAVLFIPSTASRLTPIRRSCWRGDEALADGRSSSMAKNPR